MEAFDSPEFWNPKVKGGECLNRQAARSILPIADLRTRMVMAGHSKAEIVSALKAAFDNKQLPDLEDGAMALMMSKSAHLYDEGDHNGPQVMFSAALQDGKDWGAGASPVVSGPYWSLSPNEPSQAKGLLQAHSLDAIGLASAKGICHHQLGFINCLASRGEHRKGGD
jgi:hypothetical protein